jgi:hypothetical protein
MIKFKNILYSLFIIVPNIFGIKNANMFDYTGYNNKYGFPTITSFSKDQSGCGTCGFQTMSRLLENYATASDFVNGKGRKNYDFSVNFLIDIILTDEGSSTIQCKKVEDMGIQSCGFGNIVSDPTSMPSRFNKLVNWCKNKYGPTTQLCYIETNYCPYTYGNGYVGPSYTPVNKLCTTIYQDTDKILKNIQTPTIVNLKMSFPFMTVIKQLYDTALASPTPQKDLEGFYETVNQYFPTKLSLYMPHCNGDQIKDQLITSEFLLNNCEPTPAGRTNHAVTVVGAGTWDNKFYLKILNSYGNSFGDNNFFYLELIDGASGLLNMYIGTTFAFYIPNKS